MLLCKASRVLQGFLQVLGAPAVKLGDLVNLRNFPSGQWGGLGEKLASKPLRVRRVRHVFQMGRGFFTRLEF